MELDKEEEPTTLSVGTTAAVVNAASLEAVDSAFKEVLVATPVAPKRAGPALRGPSHPPVRGGAIRGRGVSHARGGRHGARGGRSLSRPQVSGHVIISGAVGADPQNAGHEEEHVYVPEGPVFHDDFEEPIRPPARSVPFRNNVDLSISAPVEVSDDEFVNTPAGPRRFDFVWRKGDYAHTAGVVGELTMHVLSKVFRALMRFHLPQLTPADQGVLRSYSPVDRILPQYPVYMDWATKKTEITRMGVMLLLLAICMSSTYGVLRALWWWGWVPAVIGMAFLAGIVRPLGRFVGYHLLGTRFRDRNSELVAWEKLGPVEPLHPTVTDQRPSGVRSADVVLSAQYVRFRRWSMTPRKATGAGFGPLDWLIDSLVEPRITICHTDHKVDIASAADVTAAALDPRAAADPLQALIIRRLTFSGSASTDYRRALQGSQKSTALYAFEHSMAQNQSWGFTPGLD